ncbi:MAG: ATP-binding protein, partial [Prevotellaceae bacterium]|nr:ATP-binding protein [Prevotellaceae bacterium]
EGVEVLSNSINDLVIAQANRHGIELDARIPSGDLLSSLITQTSRKENKKVAILIDECDKISSDFPDNQETTEEVCRLLQNFYIRIKANDQYLRFVFIADMSRFAKFGVFSELNSLIRISSRKRCGEMCGFTEEEIVRCFPDYIADAAKATGDTPEGLLERMRDYYGGFCFDGAHRLYNPYSVLCFFREKAFRNYWTESDNYKSIARYFRTKKLTVEQFREILVSDDFDRMPGEVFGISPERFLYQSGCLTIRKEGDSTFILDYPNREVRDAMSELQPRNIRSAAGSFENPRTLLLTALSKKNIEMLTKALNSLLADIPFDHFASAGESDTPRCEFTVRERLYRSSIFAFLRGCGVEAFAEMHTNLGRSDLVVRYGGNTFVLELKAVREPEKVPAILAEAEKLMRAKNYLVPFPGATGLALVIDSAKHRITDVLEIT